MIGVIPKALEGREAAHRGLTELKVVGTMHEREQMLFDLADAFVAFPGGFGTLEEIIEMLTWKQLGIHGKPIVFANIDGYFDPVLAQFDLAIRKKYARPEDRILFAVAADTKAILTVLEGAPVLSRKPGDWIVTRAGAGDPTLVSADDPDGVFVGVAAVLDFSQAGFGGAVAALAQLQVFEELAVDGHDVGEKGDEEREDPEG